MVRLPVGSRTIRRGLSGLKEKSNYLAAPLPAACCPRNGAAADVPYAAPREMRAHGPTQPLTGRPDVEDGAVLFARAKCGLAWTVVAREGRFGERDDGHRGRLGSLHGCPSFFLGGGGRVLG